MAEATPVPVLATDGSGIPVAMTPGALLARRGPQALARELARRGFLGDAWGIDALNDELRGALHRFQRDERLPATGLPSYATVEALGMDADSVFLNAHGVRTRDGV